SIFSCHSIEELPGEFITVLNTEMLFQAHWRDDFNLIVRIIFDFWKENCGSDFISLCAGLNDQLNWIEARLTEAIIPGTQRNAGRVSPDTTPDLRVCGIFRAHIESCRERYETQPLLQCGLNPFNGHK